MNKSTLIESILLNNPITDYLTSRGIEPARSMGTRFKYLCPIHGEKSPSFYVFTQNEYQYYHCFGCSAHGDIINLVANLEGMEIKSAIGKLAWGLNIPDAEVVERLAIDIENSKSKIELSLEEIALRLSRAFYIFIQETGKDSEEVKFMEEVFKKIDKMVVAMDLDALNAIYDRIIDEGIPARKAIFESRKERDEAQKYNKGNAERSRL
jgi:DNA primase